MRSRKLSDLVVVAALCQMLLEALEQLEEEEVASEALVAELRELCERAHAELELRAQRPW